MAQIGLKDLYYAPITYGTGSDQEVYGTPVKLAKAISADIQITTGNSTLYADDGADIIIRDFQSGTITLGVADLGTANAAALLGAKVDAKGVLVSAAEDLSPAVAIGFSSRNADGNDRYFWLYRVTFAYPSQTFNTKGETIEFSTPTIEGTISRRNKADVYTNHPWKVEVNSGDTGVQASTITGWFSAVYEPSNT